LDEVDSYAVMRYLVRRHSINFAGDHGTTDKNAVFPSTLPLHQKEKVVESPAISLTYPSDTSKPPHHPTFKSLSKHDVLQRPSPPLSQPVSHSHTSHSMVEEGARSPQTRTPSVDIDRDSLGKENDVSKKADTSSNVIVVSDVCKSQQDPFKGVFSYIFYYELCYSFYQ
jgi:hypothetical protein